MNRIVFFYVALLSLGFMPQALAKPSKFLANSNLEQAKTHTSAVAEQPVKDMPRLSEIEPPHTNVQWLAAEYEPIPRGASEVIEVRGVRLNSTPNGLEVILETTSGKPLQVLNSNSGKTFITNIKNTRLALPQGNAFRSNNPAAGISAVTVTQQGANSIQVTVIGTGGILTGQVVQRDRTLVLGVTPAAETPSEPIEVVSTAKPKKPENGYRVPSATTGTKIDTPIRDIPQSIQVIPRRIIEERQILRPDELGENVSSVEPLIGLGSSSCFGTPSGYYIRGFFTYETLRNGFREFSLLSAHDLANVERVEFLKGPAAVLYGNGFSPGGIVNTVTKKPREQPFYNANLTVGNYSCYYPTLDITGPLTSNRSLSYRLNASYGNSGSFRDFINGTESYFVAPALTWRLGPRTTLTTEFEHQHSNYHFDSESFPLEPEVLRLPVNRFLGEPGLGRTNLDSNSVTYDLEHKFSKNWRFRQGFNAFVANLDIGSRFYYTSSLEPDRRTLDRIESKGPQRNENYSLQNEIYANLNTGSLRHKFLFGLELSRYIYSYKVLGATLAPIDIYQPKYGARPGPFTPLLNGEYGSDILGIYLQDLVEILPNLKLLAGGRFDLNDSYSKDRVNASTNQLSDNKFSPRVGIVYQPIKSTSLYFNWSRSFAPQFFGQSRTFEKFKPEVGEQFEVGIKQDLLKERLSATLALYQITRQNLLTPDPVDRTFSIQTGEQKSRGIELDVVGQLLPGWNIIASYAYTDAFVSRDNAIPVGNQLIGVPYNSASLWTTYELQRGNLKGLEFGLGLVYAGDVQVALPNTFRAPSYVRTDAAISYRRNNFRIGLNIKNLFSTKIYYTDNGTSLTPAPPLTVLGSVSVQF